MKFDAQQLATFAAVVHEGSFDAAARALRITPSAVSQRIKALEEMAGQILVKRAKPCRATTAGGPLLRLAGQIALLEQEAIEHTAAAMTATIVVNSDSLATWFLPALKGLPYLFDIQEDDQDFTADLLRDGSAMAAVTSQNIAVQGCRAERLGYMRYFAVAAPALARNFDFETTPVIMFNRKDQLQHRFMRTVSKRRPAPPAHYIPSVIAFTEAMRLGIGWGMAPEHQANAEIAAGRWKRIAPSHHLDVPLYWQYWRLQSPMLQTLTSAVKTAAAAYLRAHPAGRD
ncbi:LysR family transcriptional regulator ArgP [Pendulispora brunnea]|uniref:LysR family transcriptional regulator ArgP n=1 Tax=Pendulispora brunnea TaxID=2905690 RepID=A0ABZ2K380_9BACT